MGNQIGFVATLDDETVKLNKKEKEKENRKKYNEWKKAHPDYFDVRYEKLTESQMKIVEICDSMKDLLLYKNQKYGDSALNPNNIFYKGDSTNSIKIRLDDKIGRIKNCEETRINDVADVIGYCTLLLVSIGAEKKDFEKLKD